MPVPARYNPEVGSAVNVIDGALAEPDMALNAAVIPAWPSRVRQLVRPVAISEKLAFTAADKIVVFGTNVFRIVKVPLPL